VAAFGSSNELLKTLKVDTAEGWVACPPLACFV
jgi:hypothetical protein